MARYKITFGDLLVDVYEKSVGQSSRSALFLPGFPATIAENFVTKLLNQMGYCVFFPQYPGTYDSGGSFTPRASIEATKTIVTGVSKGEVENLKNQKTVTVPSKISLVVGYSFGAYIAARSLPDLPDVNSFLAMSPAFSYGPSTPDMGFSEEGMKFLSYVERTRPLTYRLGDGEEWRDFYNGKQNSLQSAKQGSDFEMLVVAGEQDSSIDASVLETGLPDFFKRLGGEPGNSTLLTVADGGHSISTLESDNTENAIRHLLKA